jgi:hypothetical protein
MSNTGREPLQLVQIDVDQCTRTYGTSPCTAALSADNPAKCFNTFKTCQDTANFNKGTLTLTFADNQSGLGKAETRFPALKSVSTVPTEINTGGVGRRTGALGRRERVSITLQDFAYQDTLTDPYQAERVSGVAQHSGVGYDPAARGLFFQRLLARNPYYIGRALRVYSGYVGDAIGSMTVSHYVITGWAGPDADGKVMVEAKDVLDLADDNKTQCPVASEGKLGADITDSYVSTVTLTPSGVGSDYDPDGRAFIGGEIVTFTRSGDVVTITGRGVDGSTAAAHSEGDTFQQCYYTADTAIDDVIYDLLVNFAGVDASFINTTDWGDEIDRWYNGFNLTATIVEPAGVASLIDEICTLGVSLWWDRENQEIKLRGNRPVDLTETVTSISDASTVVEGSLRMEDARDMRLTDVVMYHGLRDMSQEPATDLRVFDRMEAVSDTDAKGANEYNQSSIYRIAMRWLGTAGDDSVARAAVSRLLNRFRDTPKVVTFSADIKDQATLQPGNLVSLTTRLIVDATGAEQATQMRIISVEETDQGNRIKVTAESSGFQKRYGFIAENSRGDYAASSASEQEKGTYIVGGSLQFGDGSGPYLVF